MIRLINLQIALGYFSVQNGNPRLFQVKKKSIHKKEAEIHCKHYKLSRLFLSK